ncbi:MAG: heat-inducible transcriptional repressor HrcA [Mariprofundaceae bacterium]|nr:heat-inducible transcriptional repressor HrcA [Mariprofundaceae bacterium]
MKERHELILGQVIQAYLETGKAIGSKSIAEECSLQLSSASIRNAMSDLECMGLLCSPHTSAGRVPTDHGLRYFVDSLMQLDANMEAQVQQSMSDDGIDSGVMQQTLKRVSSELANITQFTGMVSLHEELYQDIQSIDLLAVSSQQILAVLMTTGGEIQNRLIPIDHRMSTIELQQLSAQLTQKLAHYSLAEIRQQLQHDLEIDRQQVHDVLEGLLDAVDQPKSKSDVMISGQRHLLDIPELSVMDTVRSMFKTFDDKDTLIHIIEQVEQDHSGVRVFIGSEHALVDMEEISMVLSPYEHHGKIIGTLGVIGPKRMAYDKVVPIVNCTANWVSRILGGKLERE